MYVLDISYIIIIQMHISGESLLNDGSVVVLYNIFSALFFNELGIDGFGQQFSVAEGFAYFFRLSLGGCCIGLAFGLATVFMLKMLNRRLSEEENVVQVVLTVSSAYLCYFTSEILCTCSGIMATIACGISVKVLGETFINDYNLTLHFWQVTAELLNTLLFVLGGCLWGKALLSTRAEDWGYLALLFVFLLLIRFILVFGLYPITTRIGIGTNWRVSYFASLQQSMKGRYNKFLYVVLEVVFCLSSCCKCLMLSFDFAISGVSIYGLWWF